METIIGLGVSVVLNIVLIVKIVLLQKKQAQHTVTEEGIRQMVDAGGSNGSIDESEKEMINNIFELSNTSVEEIATHRTDIVAVPLEATLAEIKEVLMEEKYSRIVVYEDNIDNIVGVFHVKDLVKYILTDSTRMEEGNFHLEDIMMQPYFVPFSKKTDELIEEMQREKVHMAIVIDEYGGTSGIVTMEDVMEEIVGNIFDEYDLEEEEDICPIDENSYSISGKADLQDGLDDIADLTNHLKIQAGMLVTGQGLAADLQQDPFIHRLRHDENLRLFCSQNIIDILAYFSAFA